MRNVGVAISSANQKGERSLKNSLSKLFCGCSACTNGLNGGLAACWAWLTRHCSSALPAGEASGPRDVALVGALGGPAAGEGDVLDAARVRDVAVEVGEHVAGHDRGEVVLEDRVDPLLRARLAGLGHRHERRHLVDRPGAGDEQLRDAGVGLADHAELAVRPGLVGEPVDGLHAVEGLAALEVVEGAAAAGAAAAR
jgi:hypothetical protein